MRKFLLFIALIISGVGLINAQSTNNDDEVVKIDYMNRFNSVEGEIIVKFADNTPFGLEYDRDNHLKSTGISTVDKVLKRYELVSIDRLCPNDDPKRELRSSKSYNGGDVVEHDLSRLCLVKINAPADKAGQPEFDIRALTDNLIEEFNAMDEVEFAEPNYIAYSLGMPIANSEQPTAEDDRDPDYNYFAYKTYRKEPYYSQQWGISATNIDELWQAYEEDYDEYPNVDRAVIAILDTGVDIEHPDLADNIWTNPNEIANNSDDDGNGYKDDLHGYDFVNKTATIKDYNSHGTHCAGIAAAVGTNGKGIAGANPNAFIMPVTVMQSNGQGSISTLIEGISYAKDNGADIISMSIGTYAYSIALEQVLAQAYQNSILVAAAGNDGLNIDPVALCADPTKPNKPMYPAAFTFVLGVEATQEELGDCGYRACFSNYDCDGPSYSGYSEEQLYNYELQAPGVSIISTVPNGKYKYFNGTSMACPLVAGGISALLHSKDYPSQEMLWGDLINTSGNHVDFAACYNAGPAPAQLQMVTYQLDDTENGDGDLRPDAGETMLFYPTLRTTWGAAEDITYWIEFAEYEDETTIDFISNDNIDFGHNLSAYAKSKAVNPVILKINENVVDGRYINLVLKATCPNAEDVMEYPFTIQVENGVELKGVITENTILYPDVHYIVTGNLAVNKDVTLTILPGTTLKFKDDVGLTCAGKIIAKGEPGNMITFTKTELGNGGYRLYMNMYDTLSYCIIEYASKVDSHIKREYVAADETDYRYKYLIESFPEEDDFGSYIIETCIMCYGDNVILRNCISNSMANVAGTGSAIVLKNFYKSNIFNNYIQNPSYYSFTSFNNARLYDFFNTYNNYVGNTTKNLLNYGYMNLWMFETDELLCNTSNDNFINNTNSYTEIKHVQISTEETNYFRSITNVEGLYLGSSKDEIINSCIKDFDTPGWDSNVDIDITNIGRRPSSAAHGIVWKVLVNGKDAQDEFDEVVPLGVGRHKFEVYFNRPMDVAVAPMVTMGVRPPYTQVAIAEDGSWSADSTIYTVYLDLNASTVTDGLNRIYVANARDNEYFDIPVENMRFNVQVSAAGSMSVGFEATPGIGKVDLAWENDSTYFNDHLGWNMYRYQKDTRGVNTDTILVNTEMITDTTFTDFDVVPGERYYYFYKTLRTNLTESDASTNVSTVPLTAQPGDANGSFAVDVADIVTVVSYITGDVPQPFVYGAADINGDGEIDVMDIVGIVNIIISGKYEADRVPVATAKYYIEDGILYVDTPVELGGVQIYINCEDEDDIEILSAMDKFEQVGQFVADGRYMFMAYSLSGQKLDAGKHAIMRINYGDVDEMILADVNGSNVLAIEETLGVDTENEIYALNAPYPNPFNSSINIPYIVGDKSGDITLTITNIMGQEVANINLGTQSRGKYNYEWQPKSDIPTGIYIINMNVNGNMIQRNKVVYMK